MEFLCPVMPGTALSWAHLAHLGLLGVVGGVGVPLVGLGVIAFRRSAPNGSADLLVRPAGSTRVTRDCHAPLAVVPLVQAARAHGGRIARRRR